MVNLTKRFRGKLDGVPALIVATIGMYGLCGFFRQSAHEDYKPSDIADYENPTMAECRAIHSHAYLAYLTVSMLLILDSLIYGKLIKDLWKSYSLGTDQYPRTRTKIHNTIVHWRNRAARYSLLAPPGDIVFAQDNEKYSSKGKTHANDG